MSWVGLLVIVAGLALSGAGCGDTCDACTGSECLDAGCTGVDCPNPACQQDTDCEGNRACVSGQCALRCVFQDQCWAGRVCAMGHCLDPLACGSDDDCPDRLLCQTGVCLPLTCDHFTDCPPRCFGDWQVEFQCISGLCEDYRLTDCAARGQTCRDAACSP